MSADLKPVAEDYLRDEIHLRPGSRLHRLVARLADTYIDDLSDERIIELERLADTFRITHADGSRFS
ncbi:hypothetical protein EN781_00235 [Mesorhizobium sp. M4A.F.Ca.ET.090.04.2.1]|uniref:hypothetical protein n=1 Tax=Mesorhizobium sp. M4A.F.Ca.ET.090.04.2.1 TaxID=2496663 RepID=UPI000FCC8521|nr:hypothetical protein [Mesorhizobium sp. M4A.F.Ca.ET.090.04.2.1]RVC47599.1 hypothetical protein EN781_00235 [Mesorhizobium sp. M4A.F.Ca.ET.090.04.2.1]